MGFGIFSASRMRSPTPPQKRSPFISSLLPTPPIFPTPLTAPTRLSTWLASRSQLSRIVPPHHQLPCARETVVSTTSLSPAPDSRLPPQPYPPLLSAMRTASADAPIPRAALCDTPRTPCLWTLQTNSLLRSDDNSSVLDRSLASIHLGLNRMVRTLADHSEFVTNNG